MTASSQRGLTRATAVALAAAVAASGCATSFPYSPRLDPQALPAGSPGAAKRELAGDLHLALGALQDQRRLLLAEAGVMGNLNNAAGLGLLAIGSAAVYRGVRQQDSAGWLQRAGLLTALGFGIHDWYKPVGRQQLYAGGAMALTCLALATTPYEMEVKDYNDTRENVAKARAALESLASELRLAGKFAYHSETWWLVRGGWNKLRWASEALRNADATLGQIESTGPRLLNMVSQFSQKSDGEAAKLGGDVSKLAAAIAALKPNVDLLLGVEAPKLPEPEETNADPPAGGSDKKEAVKGSAGDNTDVTPTTTEAEDSADAACPAAKVAKSPAAAASAASAEQKTLAAAATALSAAAAASSAAGDVRKVLLTAQGQAAVKAAATASARVAEIEAETRRLRQVADAARRVTERAADEAQAKDVRERLTTALRALDSSLGPVVSFVNRVASARRVVSLPSGCGEQSEAVTLSPARRSIVLQPGESFQFVLSGDSGKAIAQFLAFAPPANELDLSMPLTQAMPAVRLRAGLSVAETLNTTVRITDSRGRQSFDVAVKVCPSPARAP
jgi:hypothetical protein